MKSLFKKQVRSSKFKVQSSHTTVLNSGGWAFTCLLIICGLFAACTGKQKDLPIYGQREVNGTDTVYHKIAPFKFVDQDSAFVTNDTYKGKIYVADFSLPPAVPSAQL